MVTEVQPKMYLPGYYSMKDLSNGGSAGYGGGAWSLPHESKAGQRFGVYLSPAAPVTNGTDYDAYEKEKLRQTIMKHESIFRHQVHELHRVYRKQRDLMNEIRIKEQSSRFATGFRYEEDDKRSWCASSFPSVGSAYGTPSLPSAVEVAPPNGSSKKPQRRLFDLEVPAEEYVDDEADVEGDQSLLPNHADLRSVSFAKRTYNLADLNEPVEADEPWQSHAGSTLVYANMWSAAKQLSENRLGNLHVKSESNEKECSLYSIQAGQVKSTIFQKPGDSSRAEATVKRKIFGVEVAEGNNDATSFSSKAINVADNEPSSSTLSWTKPESSLNLNAVKCGGRGPSEAACKEKSVSLAEPPKVETQRTTLPWLRASALIPQSPVQDSLSTTTTTTTRGHEAENRRVETSDCSSVKMILGFPIFEMAAPKPNSVAPVINSPLNTVLVRNDSALVKDSSCVRRQIDLNECVVEEEAQFALPPAPIVKPMTGIDLEAPVAVETDSEEESPENKLDKPSDQSSGLFESGLDTVAAEALVAIASCRAAIDSKTDSLNLLADVISLYEENSDRDSISGDDNNVDEFERIILNLPETERQEWSYVAPVSDDPKVIEEPAARRPRRGQARRGRQRIKDFQSEVLPGMVSLSRNEVTEDLQMIEGLVRATGGTWQSSLPLRNGGGGRGRRRSSSSSSAAAAAAAISPAEQAAVCGAVQGQQGNEQNEAGIEETSLTGWGKRTRRPPRQRCPISNSLLPLK